MIEYAMLIAISALRLLGESGVGFLVPFLLAALAGRSLLNGD